MSTKLTRDTSGTLRIFGDETIQRGNHGAADFSNDEGCCWPSTATISRQIGAGESTVRTANPR